MLILLFERQVDVLTSLQGKMPEYKPMAAKADTEHGYEFVIDQSRIENLNIKHDGTSKGRFVLAQSSVENLELTTANDSGAGVGVVGGNAGTLIHEAEQKLKGAKVNVERMRSDARQIHQMVRPRSDLLSLPINLSNTLHSSWNY